eukprot:SAG25_NODE_393_length_8567_cov_15.363368_12_plen_108_part_00
MLRASSLAWPLKHGMIDFSQRSCGSLWHPERPCPTEWRGEWRGALDARLSMEEVFRPEWGNCCLLNSEDVELNRGCGYPDNPCEFPEYGNVWCVCLCLCLLLRCASC